MENTIVTNADTLAVEDTPQKTRVELVHEKMFKELEIDPVQVFNKGGLLKTIPAEWIQNIILLNAKTVTVPHIYENINMANNEITYAFDSPEECEKYFSQFNNNLYNTLNSYIEQQGEMPKLYNRILVIESTLNGNQLILRFTK